MCQNVFSVIWHFSHYFLIIIDRIRTILFIFEHYHLCVILPIDGGFKPLNSF